MNDLLTWDNVESLQPYSGWEDDWGFPDEEDDFFGIREEIEEN